MNINTAVGEIRTHYLNLPKDDLTEGGRFTAEVLEKLVATEREKVLSEVEEMLNEWIESKNWEAIFPPHTKLDVKKEFQAKLNQLKGEE